MFAVECLQGEEVCADLVMQYNHTRKKKIMVTPTWIRRTPVPVWLAVGTVIGFLFGYAVG